MIVIYKILNVKNKKFYIGSAINFRQRIYKHRFDLKHNIHINGHLQRAWNKYGEENFRFEVVEEVIDKSIILEKEQYYLDKLKPEYNIAKYSFASMTGLKHSEESKEKIAKSMCGRKHSEETKEKMRLSHNKGQHKGQIPWNKGLKRGCSSKEERFVANE